MDRIVCPYCEALVQPGTADRTGGMCMNCFDFPRRRKRALRRRAAREPRRELPKDPLRRFVTLRWWGYRRTALTITVLLISGAIFTIFLQWPKVRSEQDCRTHCSNQGKGHIYSMADGAATPFSNSAAPACRCVEPKDGSNRSAAQKRFQ